MATYYVSPSGSDGANGSSGSPWKTLTKASNTAAAGDTVRVRAGTYNEAWQFKEPNVTFIADDPNNRPVIDGNYHPGLMSTDELATNTILPRADGAGFLGLVGKSPLVRVNVQGSTLDGFIVQNSAGVGITIGASDVTVRNCVTFWTFDTGILCNPGSPVGGLLVENCEFLFASVKIFEPLRRTYTACSPNSQCVSGVAKFGNITGLTFRNNRIAFGFGEGLNIGKANLATAENPIIVEGNVAHDCNHSHIYINASRHVVVRRNIVYCGGAFVNTWGNGPPAGIRIKDEKYTYADHIWIYNNLVVNVGPGIAIGERHTKMSTFYCGYNTVVGGSDTANSGSPAIFVKRGSSVGGGDQQGIIENNLIDWAEMPTAISVLNNTTGEAGTAFRNNAWSSQPVAGMRSSSDVVGQLKLVNPRAALRTSNYLTRDQNTFATFKTTNNFNVDNYQLTKESPALGAASNRTRFNGVTPPEITTDLSGHARDDQNRPSNKFYDIGALEYGGAVVPPEDDDDVIADFTQSSTGGVAPLSVQFTDTSTVAGDAVINRRDWDFGDGTTTVTSVTNLTHAYTAPGTYTPKLSIRDSVLNLGSTKNGQPIVVSAPPVNQGEGVFDVVRALTPGTAGGDMTLTFDLNGHAPELVIILMARSPMANTSYTDGALSIGAATPGAQWCHVIDGKDAIAPTNTDTYSSRQAVAVYLRDDEIKGTASILSFAANRVTLRFTAGIPPTLLTAIGIGGAQYRAAIGDFMLGADGQSTTLPLDGVPEWYLFSGGNVAALETIEQTADVSFGMADPTTQTGFSWRDVSGRATSRVKATASKVAAVRTEFNKGYGVVEDFVHGRVAVRGGVDIQRRFLYAALEMPGAAGAVVKQFMSPATTGEQTYTLGFKPAGLLMLVSALNVLESPIASANASGFSIVAVDPAGTHSVGIASEQGAALSNSHNRVSDSLHVMGGDGAAVLAGTVTLTDTGFKINWTTVAATPRVFNVTAFRANAVVQGPNPMFEADTTTPPDGRVTFTDLSNPNGAAITAWEWDFGDGGTSSERNPTHTYTDYGEFTVSLTVTNANGSETITRAKYIRYADVAGTSWLGVYEPRTVTNDTVNRLYGNDPDHPLYGFIEHALNLDGMEIDAYPEDMETPRPGKLRILSDLDNDRLVLVLPNGTIRYMSFDD